MFAARTQLVNIVIQTEVSPNSVVIQLHELVALEGSVQIYKKYLSVRFEAGLISHRVGIVLCGYVVVARINVAHWIHKTICLHNF